MPVGIVANNGEGGAGQGGTDPNVLFDMYTVCARLAGGASQGRGGAGQGVLFGEAGREGSPFSRGPLAAPTPLCPILPSSAHARPPSRPPPRRAAGILFSDAALKGAHFVQLCAQRGVPLLFLQARRPGGGAEGLLLGASEYLCAHTGRARDGKSTVCSAGEQARPESGQARQGALWHPASIGQLLRLRLRLRLRLLRLLSHLRDFFAPLPPPPPLP